MLFGHTKLLMSKKTTRQTDFVKWFGPVLDAMRALGGFADRKKLQNELLRPGKRSAAECIFNF